MRALEQLRYPWTRSRGRKLAAMAATTMLLSGAALADWPQVRGPAGDGRGAADGALAVENLAMEVAWRVPLGSGYSGIAVAGGKVLTGYTAGEADWLGAFDSASGENLWKVRLGDYYKGHDGSDDGPLSSPVVQGERVFFLDGFGRLLAVSLGEGKLLWEKDLTKSYGAEAPFYGFTTTPVSEGDIVVLAATGTEGRSMVGLDGGTGEERWAYGDLAVEYQSPMAVELGGRRQIVVPSDTRITGLAADTGEMLWQHSLDEDESTGSTAIVGIGEDRFLAPISGEMAAFQIKASSPGGSTPFVVEEVYRSNVLGRSYAAPVLHKGTLYGFRGQVLAAMDAATGERKWRSREPGGDGLLVVDDHLVIFGSKGNVVVAEANPEEYVEVVRVQALEGSSLTLPSFSDHRIFVRNLEELAAVALTTGSAEPAGEMETANHGFGAWVAKVEAAKAPARPAMVAEYLEENPGGPVVEDGWVHFLYQGEAEDVAIAASMLDERRAEPMHRIEGTDLFYRSYRIDPRLRLEYLFQTDFDVWVADPRNPETVPGVDGDNRLSELRPEGHAQETHLVEPEAPKGKLETFELESAVLEGKKEITVWLPPGYSAQADGYPLLVVNDGSAWKDRGLLVHSLENLVGESVAPVVVAFVAPARRWWTEGGGGATEVYSKMLADELVPAMEERYNLRSQRSARALLGQRYYGIAAAYAALRHHRVFGQVAVQTLPLNVSVGDEVVSMIEGGNAKNVRVYLDWNRLDEHNGDRGYDLGADSARLAGLLAAHGSAPAGGEQLDTTGWGGWRSRSDEILTFLFPEG